MSLPQGRSANIHITEFSVPLFQQGFGGFVLAGPYAFAVHEAGAGVPAEEGVVVAGGAEGGGFFVELHGFVEVVVGHGAGEGGVVVEEFLGVAFGDEAGVVGAVVVALEASEDVFGFDFFHFV